MKFKKSLCAALVLAMALSITACSPGSENNPSGTGDDGSGTNSTVGSFTEGTAPPIDETADAGKVKYLTYENEGAFEGSSSELIALFKERYNGTFDVDRSCTSLDYSEKLGVAIATGDSPDLTRYEGWTFPHGMSYNMFTCLDSYFDIDSDLWKDMKGTIEQYAYNGKHFYFPYRKTTSFALNYNNRVLEENGMPDPMQYVKDNTWTWSKFEEMLKQWKDIDPVNNISYNGVGALAFSGTTGKKIIDIKDGEIINNLKDPDIVRCMQWLEELKKQGLIGATAEQQAAGMTSGYIDPGQAFVGESGSHLLFLGMEPGWAHPAAMEGLWNKKEVGEMKFIPFPRDEQADKWYQYTGTFGYLVPAGAKNVKGALDWITLLREEEIDPENVASAKDEATDDSPAYYSTCPNADCGDTSENADDKGRHVYTTEEDEQGVTVCPVCGTPRKEKYKAVWSEEQWDLYMTMMNDGELLTLMYDNLYGFNNDFKSLFVDGNETLLDGLCFGADYTSYTSEMEAIYGSVEGYLQPYRDRMKADANGEEVTTTPPQTEENAE